MDDEARRQALLDRIEALRTRWHQLVEDVGADRLEVPGAMGAWTFKDVAAHVTAWRRRTVSRLEAAARGEPTPPNPWPAELGEDEDDPINAWLHDQTKDRPADQILADADRVYDDLIAAIRSLPLGATTDPHAIPSLGGQALVDADFSGHLVQHEADVRAWLAGEGHPTREAETTARG